MRGNLLLTALAAAGRALEREGGAYALYIEGLSIRAVSVASERGHRPWVPEHVLSRVTMTMTPIAPLGASTAIPRIEA
jgi:hypothetical protein